MTVVSLTNKTALSNFLSMFSGTHFVTPLAARLEIVWNCADTDVRLKKRIVRTLIHEVVVDVDAEVGELILVIHWKGGVHGVAFASATARTE